MGKKKMFIILKKIGLDDINNADVISISILYLTFFLNTSGK